jgi:replication factor C large subunit
MTFTAQTPRVSIKPIIPIKIKTTAYSLFNMSKPWIRKYAPKTLNGVKGQNKAVSELKEYIENFKPGKAKALLLYGPPGNGKTVSVCALAKEYDYDLIEFNASDIRNKSSIENIIKPALEQKALFSKGKIILMDEIDGLSGHQDRGGISSILKLTENISYPLILTANDIYTQKLRGLRKKCKLIEFHALSYVSVYNYLKNICQKENIKYNDSVLKQLARQCGGDMRAAVNDLQVLTTEGELRDDSLINLDQRKQKESIFNALKKVFKTTSPETALGAFDDVDEDLEEIFLWIENNIPKEYVKPRDLSEGFENLSKADVFHGRIKRWQYYRYYVYIYNLLTAGIALSKKERYKQFVSYARSMRPLRIWQANRSYQQRKEISAKIAEKTHCSSKEALQSTVPYMKRIFKENKKQAENISNFLELDKKEVEWLEK